MKFIKKLLLITIILPILSSCSWLDVDSDTNILEDDLFLSESGYFSALNGIYLLMSDADLYSHHLTKGLYTIMSGMYNNAYYYPIYAYRSISEGSINNESVDMLTGTIWSKSYRTIANCNNLINYAEAADKKMFSAGRRELIIGEAQAIRAMLHFDVLVLFAPAVVAGDSNVKIPYVNNFPVYQPEYKSPSEVLDMVIEDLIAARENLRVIDVDLNPSNMTSEKLFDDRLISSSELPTSIRGTHINYFAASVLLCRAYMYKGDYAAAKEIALELYEYGPDGADENKQLFEFTPTNAEDFKLKSEEDVLFATYNVNLMEHYIDTKSYAYEFNASYIDNLFAGQTDYDIRYSQLLTSTERAGSDLYYSRRWYLGYAGEDTDGFEYCLSPLVRFSEVYHFLAECYAREGNLTDAMKVINQMRQYRGKMYTGMDDSGELISRPYMPAVTASTTEDAVNVITSEYVRESLDEGRALWMYKRLEHRTGVVTKLNIPRAETDYMTL